MSKELEKEYLEDLDHYDEGMGIHSTSYKNCKERLVRLAKIDSASPSEALEIVDKMANYILLDEEYGFIDKKEKQAIIQDRDKIKATLQQSEQDKKKARAFDIINRGVDMIELTLAYSVNEYNIAKQFGGELTEEEFELLKEMM